MHKTIISLFFVATCYGHTITADGVTNLGAFNFDATFTDPIWTGTSALSINYIGFLTSFSDGSNGTVDSVSLFGLGPAPGATQSLQANFGPSGSLLDLSYLTGPGGDFLTGFSWDANGQQSAFWQAGQSRFIATGTVTGITIDGTPVVGDFAPEPSTLAMVVLSLCALLCLHLRPRHHAGAVARQTVRNLRSE